MKTDTLKMVVLDRRASRRRIGGFGYRVDDIIQTALLSVELEPKLASIS